MLRQGVEEMWAAVRDRVELSGHDPTWQVTAGSFDTALAYARARFGAPVVLARRDRDRWWPRVTLVVSTDASRAASAPSIEELASTPVLLPPRRWFRKRPSGPLPPSLEAIFVAQEERRLAIARQRTGDHDMLTTAPATREPRGHEPLPAAGDEEAAS